MSVEGQEITAGWTTLLEQASMTADTYLREAIRRIDDQLGKGYARDHPELVAAFMKVASEDLRTSAIGVAAQQIRDAIAAY